MADLSKLTDQQLLELKAASGDLSKLSNETLLALKGQASAGYSDKLAQSFGQGATFGTGDELAAGVRALAPDFSNWMMSGPALQRDESIGGSPTPQTVSTAPTFQGRYDEELARERTKLKDFQQTNPITAGASNLAGNVATTALALPAGLTAAGPNWIVNALKMGATGGALGGAQGFAEGEGGFQARAGNAVIPAATGAALGGTISAGGTGLRQLAEQRWTGIPYLSEKVVSPLARTLARVVGESNAPRSLSAAAPDGTAGVAGPLTEFANATQNVAQTGAIDRLAMALQRSGMTPEQIRGRLKQLGPESMLADVDPQFLSSARAAQTLPGETKSLAPMQIKAREKMEPGILRSAFEGDQPPPSNYQLAGEGQALEQYPRAVGKAAYQGDMVAGGLNQTPEFRALLDNPVVNSAIEKVTGAIKEARQARPNSPAPSPIEVMHMVKQEIQNLGFDQMSGRPLSTQQVMRDLATDFVSTLKKGNPALAEADTAYSQAKSLPDFYDLGRNALIRGTGEKATASSAAGLEDVLPKATRLQQLVARAGMTNTVRAQTTDMGALPATRALARGIPAEGVSGKISALYDPAHAADIQRAADAINTYAGTAGALRGPNTAEKLVEAGDELGSAAIRANSGGGVHATLYETLAKLASGVGRPNEAVRNEIGRATLNMDPSEKERLVRLIAANLARRQQGSPLAASLAGSSGSIMGGSNF